MTTIALLVALAYVVNGALLLVRFERDTHSFARNVAIVPGFLGAVLKVYTVSAYVLLWPLVGYGWWKSIVVAPLRALVVVHRLYWRLRGHDIDDDPDDEDEAEPEL